MTHKKISEWVDKAISDHFETSGELSEEALNGLVSMLLELTRGGVNAKEVILFGALKNAMGRTPSDEELALAVLLDELGEFAVESGFVDSTVQPRFAIGSTILISEAIKNVYLKHEQTIRSELEALHAEAEADKAGINALIAKAEASHAKVDDLFAKAKVAHAEVNVLLAKADADSRRLIDMLMQYAPEEAVSALIEDGIIFAKAENGEALAARCEG